MPAELEAVDRLLDDPAFFEPFVAHFHAVLGRPSLPIETYLRLMFLEYRYRLGFEPLCREVADSISWQRFCRIPLGVAVPHPTTLMKITTRCGTSAIDALNEALLAKAAQANVLKTNKLRADTTVVPANQAYPMDWVVGQGGGEDGQVHQVARDTVVRRGRRPVIGRGRCGPGPVPSERTFVGAAARQKTRSRPSIPIWRPLPRRQSTRPAGWLPMRGAGCGSSARLPGQARTDRP